ncbi:UNVERIFIED_CONTAM: hypothetical protein GTU68_010263 [Idotea baltica]|nr:hypothetical protein [Idotea baltica]
MNRIQLLKQPSSCIFPAKLWNENGKKTPILALHGWMDNAGTWDHICPILDSDHPLVAIDAAGHGLSSPCLGMGSYITDNLVTMERVLLYLQWNKIYYKTTGIVV